MKSEWYKMLHRRCTYVFLAVFVGGGFFLNLVIRCLAAEGSGIGFGNEVMAFWIQIVGNFSWFLVLMIAQIIYSNENKIGVLKNSISFGISRTKMYIGRFLTQLITLVIAVILVVVAVLLGNQLFNGGCSGKILTEFLQSIATTGILWIAVLSVAHALSMCLNSNSLGTVMYCLYFFVGTSILYMMHQVLPNNQIITFLNKYEIYGFATNCIMQNTMMENLPEYFMIGGVYFAVSFGLGLFFYRRKEVR